MICRLSNDPECLILYLALLVSGAVPLLTADNLENEKYTELLIYISHMPYTLKDVSGTSDCFYDETLSKYTVNKFSGDMPIYEISDELALLLPTSGIAGSPKYVRISHKNLISNTEAICYYLKIISSDKVITTFTELFLWSILLHTHFIQGSTIIATNATFFEQKFWDLLSIYEVTTYGVPFH